VPLIESGAPPPLAATPFRRACLAAARRAVDRADHRGRAEVRRGGAALAAWRPLPLLTTPRRERSSASSLMIGIAVSRRAFLQPIGQKLQVDFDGLVAHESAVTLFSSECKREPDLGGSRGPENSELFVAIPLPTSKA
jgi:hypothetical protein